MTREDLKSIKGLYTKDGTIIVPNGREFMDLKFALKAYDLGEDEFINRLEKGASVREAFCGIDLPCGLVFNEDGFLSDGKSKYKTLEDMCRANNATVEMFNRLYAITHSVTQSLLQTKHTTSSEYISQLEKDKEDKEKQDREKKDEEERLKIQKERDFQELSCRLKEARCLLNSFIKVFISEDANEGIYYESARMILSLLEFVESKRLLSTEEKKLKFKMKTRLDIGLPHTAKYPKAESLVIHIISGIELKEVEKQLQENHRLRDIYINKLAKPSNLPETVSAKELIAQKKKAKADLVNKLKKEKRESKKANIQKANIKKANTQKDRTEMIGDVKTSLKTKDNNVLVYNGSTLTKQNIKSEGSISTRTSGQSDYVLAYKGRTKKLSLINEALLGYHGSVYEYVNQEEKVYTQKEDTEDDYAKIQKETVAKLESYLKEFSNEKQERNTGVVTRG